MDVRLLGPLEVLAEAGPVALGGARQRAVLARLALEPGRVVSVDRLIDDIWGDRLPARPAATLQVAVARVRAALGADGRSLVTRPPGYLLDVPKEAVDASRFEAIVAAAGSGEPDDPAEVVALLRRALSAWRGPPMADVADAPFATSARARLDELRTAAMESLVEARLGLGEHAAVVPELEGLVREHPFRERLWGQLMLALYRCGRQADALAAYRRCRRELADAQGIEPGADLQRLEEAILLQKSELDWRPSNDAPGRRPARPADAGVLPIPHTTFVGRDDELGDLLDAVTRSRLVTVTGPGGVGKTRLALAAAELLAGSMRHGAAFCDLTGIPARRVEAAVAAALTSQNPSGPDDDRLVERLTGRELVLVLDGADLGLEGVAELAARLLTACPRLHLLVTSRSPLRVPGERLTRVAPLAVSAPDDAAARLFRERAALVPAGDVDDEAVLALCRLLDGLPLAIELAAARLRSVPIGHLLAELGGHLSSPDEVAARNGRRGGMLAEVVDWSVDLLDEGHRCLLRRLAVFSGGCTAAAAATVCGIDGDPVDALAELVDRSLVQLEDREGPPRYRLLETLRSDGMARLVEHGELDEFRARHLAWCLSLVPEPSADHGEDPAAMEPLDHEIDNVVAALAWSLAGADVARGGRLAAAVAPWWVHAGRLTEARRWLERAASAAARPADEGAILHRLGWVLTRQGDLAAARRMLGEALRLATAGRDDEMRVDVEILLALAEIAAGELELGEGRLRAVVGTPAVREVDRRRALVSFGLGNRALMAGDLPKAAAILEDAAQAARVAGMRTTLVRALVGLAQAESGRRRFARADGAIADALATARRSRLVGAMPAVLGAAGILAYRMGDAALGRTRFEEGLAAARVAGDLHAEVAALANLGTAAQNEGRSMEAIELFEEALALAGRTEDDRTAMIIAANLAEAVLTGTHDTRRALSVASDALVRARRSGVRIGTVAALETVAFALTERGEPGDLERAAWFLGACAAVREELDHPDDAGESSPAVRSLHVIRRALGEGPLQEALARGARVGLERLADGFVSEPRSPVPDPLLAS